MAKKKAKKKHTPKKKSLPKPVIHTAIIVFFTKEGLIKIGRANHTTIMCYGEDVALPDTMAMSKILKAVLNKKSSVIIGD